jgi:hypothetical protein
MEGDKVLQQVEALLSDSPKSARDFLRSLKKDGLMSEEGKKKAVNSALYKLKKEGKAVATDSTPPLWTRAKTGTSPSGSEDESSEEEITAVFIDVTNSPCHGEAIKYAKKDTPVYIVANHEYPAALPSSSSFVSVKKCAEGVHVMAQLLITATAFACTMQALKRPTKMLIVSLSNMVNSVDDMLKVATPNVKVEIIKDGWEGLRLHLE